MLRAVIQHLRQGMAPPSFPRQSLEGLAALRGNVLEVRNAHYLKSAMSWTRDPVLEEDRLRRFRYIEDLNDRPLRDAEALGAACCNGEPKILLEIGTSLGQGTALMAQNAPQATVYTVNMLPEEAGEAGSHITHAPGREAIGSYYREKGLTNVKQIFANTADWTPDFGPIDVAYIDGCHDAEFVYNDTRKILSRCRPGSLILWHDFAPELTAVYSWIGEVCKGIEQLYRDRLLQGPILHLRDSWIGLYRVPERGSKK